MVWPDPTLGSGMRGPDQLRQFDMRPRSHVRDHLTGRNGSQFTAPQHVCADREAVDESCCVLITGTGGVDDMISRRDPDVDSLAPEHHDRSLR